MGLWNQELRGAAVALAPGEPELLHGFPAASRKLKWLFSGFVTSHGENDHINGVV